MNSTEIQVVVFDVGGVLVEIIGGAPLLRWTGDRFKNEAELFHAWICSPAVQSYERGKCDLQFFAREIVEELALPVSVDEFIREFSSWPNGLWPGAKEMLEQTRQSRLIACLSNTNDHHWLNQKDADYLNNAFDQMFLSYEMGMVKPDLEIYHTAAAQLGVNAESILFIDDNQVNVDGASEAGMQAHLGKGVDQVSEILRAHNCLDR